MIEFYACSSDAEEWRAIPGYEGLYEVSSFGNVRALDRVAQRRNRWGTISPHPIAGGDKKLTLEEPSPGYFRYSVGLSKDGKCTTRLVHQIVLEAFVGPRPEGAEVAHNDGNSLNNRLENLRYATPAENTNDKIKHGTLLQGNAVGTAKLTVGDVRFIRHMKGMISGADLARKFNIGQAQVTRIQKRERWRHVL